VGEVTVSKNIFKNYTNRGADMWDLNAHVRQVFACLKEEVKSGQCISALQGCFRKHFLIIVYRTEPEQYTTTCVLPAERFVTILEALSPGSKCQHTYFLSFPSSLNRCPHSDFFPIWNCLCVNGQRQKERDSWGVCCRSFFPW
jgi:hypothetical protein